EAGPGLSGAPRLDCRPGFASIALMSTLTVEIEDGDKNRLADVARRAGISVEEAAAAAVKLEADAAARREIEAGLAELDAGAGVSLEDVEQEMDAFMRDLRLG